MENNSLFRGFITHNAHVSEYMFSPDWILGIRKSGKLPLIQDAFSGWVQAICFILRFFVFLPSLPLLIQCKCDSPCTVTFELHLQSEQLFHTWRFSDSQKMSRSLLGSFEAEVSPALRSIHLARKDKIEAQIDQLMIETSPPDSFSHRRATRKQEGWELGTG